MADGFVADDDRSRTEWWFVARRSYGTPSAYGNAREQAEIAADIV
ncbi:hypothetical protein ACFRCW_30650 [Streptomyces sp. NPDC056653]